MATEKSEAGRNVTAMAQDATEKHDHFPDQHPPLEVTEEQNRPSDQDTFLQRLRIAITWRTILLFITMPTLALICMGGILMGIIYLIKLLPYKPPKFNFFTGLAVAVPMLSPLLPAFHILDNERYRMQARLQAAGYREKNTFWSSLNWLVTWVASLMAYKWADSRMGSIEMEWSSLGVWTAVLWLIIHGAIWTTFGMPVLCSYRRVDEIREPQPSPSSA